MNMPRPLRRRSDLVAPWYGMLTHFVGVLVVIVGISTKQLDPAVGWPLLAALLGLGAGGSLALLSPPPPLTSSRVPPSPAGSPAPAPVADGRPATGVPVDVDLLLNTINVLLHELAHRPPSDPPPADVRPV